MLITDDANPLDRARTAYEDRRWDEALAAYREARDDVPLTPDDLDALAMSAWWLGAVDEWARTSEEAYHRLVETDRREEAASLALHAGFLWMLRGDSEVGRGWLSRAGRLLDGLPQSSVHGYVLYYEMEDSLSEARLERAAELAREMTSLAERFDDPTLEALGLAGQGIAAVKSGEPGEGFAMLDEAMLPIMGGRVDPEWVGNIYCRIMDTCQELSDLGRARRWTEATQRWCDQFPSAAMFGGICRVHRAQFLMTGGDWDRAEVEAQGACEDLARMNVVIVAEGRYQIGEVRRLRGDLSGAVEAFAEAERLGRRPQPGMALVRLAEGRSAEAAASIGTAVAAERHDRLARAPLRAAQVSISLTIGDVGTAREAADDLAGIAETFQSSGLEASSIQATGAVLAASDALDEALPLLEEAVRRWSELEAPHHAAEARMLLAAVCRRRGDEYSARREEQMAEATFDRLGADPAWRGPTGVPREPHGLSDREIEVIGLVANGDSNRQIAESLFISEKTVARHLSNIFAKLGVSSRTAAARYAYDHGLTDG